MQETSGHQAPPLALEDAGPELGAELVQRARVQIHEPTAVTQAHAVDHRGDVEPHVDQQDHRGGEALVWNQPAEDIGRTPPIDRPLAHRLMAIRADAIAVGDERPAVRAHAARIHRKRKSKGKWQMAKVCRYDVTIPHLAPVAPTTFLTF